MKEPSFTHYIILVFCSLFMAMVGLYLLANFNRLFKGSIRNETLRKNAAAWIIIFFTSAAIAPISSGFFLLLIKFGWLWTVLGHIISTTLSTVLVFNTARFVAEGKWFQRLSFLKHKLLVFLTLIIMTLVVNTPVAYILYDYQTKYLKYTIISSIYISGTIGLVYAVTSYLAMVRKRQFDEKELELSRLRESKAKAELDALHSKVNPHFLYNALNSIADLSITDGRKARKMTIALADLFRYSINYSQHNFSTVNDEVAMTEVYLQIEKIRFEDQLNYRVQVDEEMGHYLVPRFILQPLVENAVKHGLKRTGQMTEIILEVRKKEEGMLITVADNGPAFPDEMIPGYGVKSVFDKMDLLFPGQYEIHFTNQPVKQVSIYIHKLVKNEPAV
ncbi:MAG TPA: histidine kinase [Chitinophagaceae bacterium]|nr:histidine kinase [Chitinophagaceae bacterium]